jgi:hypothetical protein
LLLPAPVRRGHWPKPGWSRLRGNVERLCRSGPRWRPRSKLPRSPAHHRSRRSR